MLSAIEGLAVLAMLAPIADETVSKAHDPQPLASPASWINGAADYPPAAQQLRLEGEAGIELTVSANGRVTGCRAISSSGHDILDRTTCRLASERAKFRPAKDASGVAVAGIFSARLAWKLQDNKVQVPTDTQGRVLYLLRQNDSLAFCGTSYTPPPRTASGAETCIGSIPVPPPLLELLRDAGGKGDVKIALDTSFALSDASMAAQVADQKGWRRVALAVAWFTVDDMGWPVDCRTAESRGATDFILPICSDVYRMRFTQPVDEAGKATTMRLGMSSVYYVADSAR